jgi:cell division protein FtsW
VLAIGLAAAVRFSDYRVKRFMIFLNPWKDPQGAGYQIIQSLIAIGSGGVMGRGLMEGVQKRYYLPEPHTDFIYSVVAEEFGLVGTTVVLVLFAMLAWRGLRVALLAPDRFGSLLALGITLIVSIQGLMNISVVTALMPTKGIPLPLVSNGGSSLVITMCAIGILLNISQHASATAGVLASGRNSGWTLEEQEA